MVAANFGRTLQVELLLAAGADPNAVDNRGTTPLMHAFQASVPDVDLARKLIAAGANPAAISPAGFTAREYAEAFEDPALMEVFDR
jgi:hypothetical protein